MLGELFPLTRSTGTLPVKARSRADARRDLSRIEDVVPGAVALTRRVAEILYLIRELTYIPRTIDNIARLLVENTSDDLPTLINRIRP